MTWISLLGSYQQWVTPVLVDIVIALVIFLLGLIIGRLAGKLAGRLLHQLRLDDAIQRATPLRLSIEHTIAAVLTYTIYIVALIMALTQIGIATTALTILLVLVAIATLTSLLLALRDMLPNALSGIMIRLRAEIKEGDRISIDGNEGVVKHTSLLYTHLETKRSEMLILPNTIFLKRPCKRRRTKGHSRRR